MQKIFPRPFLITLSFLSFHISIIGCKKDNVTADGKIRLDLLDSVNLLRANGCICGVDTISPSKLLIWNNSLAKAAEAHAKDMFMRNYFDHISLGQTSPIQRAETANYHGTTVSENIAKGYKSAALVMDAWKKSEFHCKAMMDSSYIEMGAYSYNGYWVQEFGK